MRKRGHFDGLAAVVASGLFAYCDDVPSRNSLLRAVQRLGLRGHSEAIVRKDGMVLGYRVSLRPRSNHE